MIGRRVLTQRSLVSEPIDPGRFELKMSMLPSADTAGNYSSESVLIGGPTRDGGDQSEDRSGRVETQMS